MTVEKGIWREPFQGHITWGGGDILSVGVLVGRSWWYTTRIRLAGWVAYSPSTTTQKEQRKE